MLWNVSVNSSKLSRRHLNLSFINHIAFSVNWLVVKIMQVYNIYFFNYLHGKNYPRYLKLVSRLCLIFVLWTFIFLWINEQALCFYHACYKVSVVINKLFFLERLGLCNAIILIFYNVVEEYKSGSLTVDNITNMWEVRKGGCFKTLLNFLLPHWPW